MADDTGDIDELMSVLQRGDRLGVSELPPARVGRWVFAEVERDLISGLGEQWNRKYGRRLDLGPPE